MLLDTKNGNARKCLSIDVSGFVEFISESFYIHENIFQKPKKGIREKYIFHDEKIAA